MDKKDIELLLSSMNIIKCEKCGSDMNQNTSICYTSYPPKYEYNCTKCGNKVIK